MISYFLGGMTIPNIATFDHGTYDQKWLKKQPPTNHS